MKLRTAPYSHRKKVLGHTWLWWLNQLLRLMGLVLVEHRCKTVDRHIEWWFGTERSMVARGLAMLGTPCPVCGGRG